MILLSFMSTGFSKRDFWETIILKIIKIVNWLAGFNGSFPLQFA